MNLLTKMLVSLTTIGIISAVLLSEVNSWALPKIVANRKAETERAIFVVQPNATKYKTIENINFELYEAFDDNDNSLGYALPYEGNGFQGKIRLIIGLHKDIKNIIGLEVLEQVETPGLGTKVTETHFTDQFKNLLVKHEIELVKGVPTQEQNEIQAITGATISSKAIVKIINDGINKLRSENIVREKSE